MLVLVSSMLGAQSVAEPPSVADERADVSYNRDIRPILSAACFRCHGQDAEHRQAELRLDQSESALATRDTGTAIVASDPEHSLVWQRIVSTDPDTIMPPPNATRQLTAEEKVLLQRWIAQGAKYEKHWAFEPIVAPKSSVPEAPKSSVSEAWNGSQRIDAWLDLEIERQQLPKNGRADPRTLVRRLAFALTGLPPSVDDVNRFAANPSDAEYERLVDQYLGSQAYGEEMAKHWLDVARYGDTHGLHLDNDRWIWPYRDWVSRAFQTNMPFSQFTIEQLAGDLLPDPTESQKIATGFNRCNVTTSEGGAINDEFLFRYSVDRTSTTIQAWLGLTGGCAVCHDHKYDPLTTREFYSMYSFFYSAADPAMDGNVNTTAPFLKLPTPEQESRLRELREREKQSLDALQGLARQWSALTPDSADETAVVAGEQLTHVWLDDTLPLGATQRNTARNDIRWTEPGEPVPMGSRAVVTEFGNKFEQVILGGLVPNWIPGEAKIQAWVQTDAMEPPRGLFLEVRTDKGAKRWVWTNDPADAVLVDAGPDRVIGRLPKPGAWQLLQCSASELTAGANVQEIKFGVYGGIARWDGIAVTGSARTEDKLRSDWRAWWGHRKGQGAPHASAEVAKAIQEGPESEIGKLHQDGVKAYFFAMVSEQVPEPIARARTAWNTARTARDTLNDAIPGTMIFNDRPEPRQAHIMTRGQYDAKGEPVTPGTPAILPRLAATGEARLNRLDLAKWLVSGENPLVARVAVNRLWQQLFGVGIVKTSDDFGTQGTPPSHPELLDELAHRFQSTGWNVKQWMKEAVMTEAFRRDSRMTPSSLAVDPENRTLSRGPRIRLDAEQIRDNALAVSGLLNRQFGGPGFRGYQPPNLWEPVGYGDSNTRYYIQQHGDEIYRRSLYAYVKRTAPPPFMSNFDAPNRETVCTKRERSNTPLQALQLMNDVQHFEAARFLAERLLHEPLADDRSRLDRVFEWVLARQPDEVERTSIQGLLDATRQRIAQSPQDALQIAEAGERWRDARLPTEDVAVWAIVCNLLLNLDETITRN
jgi:hypothetical protein